MKAAQISEYGDVTVLKLTDQAGQPEPAEGQVLVEVHAAATNPFDFKVREGMMKDFFAVPFPATLGGDCAGVVAAVGAGVTDFEVGQEVFGQANAVGGQGSYAEFTAVKAASLAAKPSSVDFVTAAALPLAASSAYQALVEHMQLQAGQKIMIHGGAGGLGTMAIQLAKHLGAHVTTSSTAADTEFVQGLGADEVIDYQIQDFVEVLSDMDAVFDTVGGETNVKSYSVLKSGGTLVSMVAPVDEALAEQHHITYVQQFSHVTTAGLTEIAKLVDAGELKVNIDKVFPLEQASEALEYLKTAHPRGKVVIQVK
jgi:alcohol dehydrogenase